MNKPLLMDISILCDYLSSNGIHTTVIDDKYIVYNTKSNIVNKDTLDNVSQIHELLKKTPYNYYLTTIWDLPKILGNRERVTMHMTSVDKSQQNYFLVISNYTG